MALILVVDDDPLWLEVHERVLHAAGHEVHLVLDVRDAVEDALERFDLIITDYDMPFVDGASFAREVHDRLRHHAPPLILVSAYAEKEACAEGAALFAAVHRKPYVAAALVADVERILQLERQRRRSIRTGQARRAAKPQGVDDAEGP